MHPPTQSKKVNFKDIFAGGEGERVTLVNFAVLGCVLRATTEKSHQLFEEKKSTPRDSPGYAYGQAAFKRVKVGRRMTKMDRIKK